jgi:ABC-2 type transport system ATP-binding protein
MIELTGLTKKYGSVTAVENLTTTIAPGIVTGFLGPNGAGKSTTMRMIVGLDRPTSGMALVNGRSLPTNRRALTEVGTLLDAGVAHPNRTARNHLTALAQSNGLAPKRVEEVLDMVGLGRVADKRAGGFSLGMRQRLGLAAALIGDAPVLLLDEPVNGLDPDGVLWLRGFLHQLAAGGRTVLLSSHLMTEMAMVAQHVIVIGKGRLLADQSLTDLIAGAGEESVRVRTRQPDILTQALLRGGKVVTDNADGSLTVSGTASGTGDIAASLGIALHELSPITASLEDAYLELTQDSVTYTGTSFTPALVGAATRSEA